MLTLLMPQKLRLLGHQNRVQGCGRNIDGGFGLACCAFESNRIFDVLVLLECFWQLAEGNFILVPLLP